MSRAASTASWREGLPEARQRLAAVHERIAIACARAGRAPESVTLVGIAKRQPRTRVLAAIGAGLRVLGQNTLQEARVVLPELEAALAGEPELAATRLRWHFVGQLQRNKAGHAARLFDVIESVDRPALVDTLAARAGREGRALDVLVQVSLRGEAQKGGCPPDALEALVRQILELPALRFAGLMTVPPASADPEDARPVFRALREHRDALGAIRPELARADLSMGMSADLEVAVEEGATFVRVGTALFGDRLDKPAT